MSRPSAALASVVLMGLSLLVLLPDCASACSCMVPPGAERALSNSEAVFSGKVVEIEKPPSGPGWSSNDPETDTFRVSEVWKGPQRGTLEVETPVSGMSCGYPFKEGQEYLVYASGKQDLKVSLCSATKPLSKAGADLAVLGNGEKPVEGGDEPLTDTSGVVGARAMAGLAGLGIAASLLVVLRLVRTG